MFTSGTTGMPKAARLTYRNLMSAARASADAFMAPGEGGWQLALPLFHVGGLQVMLRALVNRSAFLLYERFDPGALLADVASGRATHVSMVEKMLKELAATGKPLLDRYKVVLLGGGPVSDRALEQARGARVFTSYGMTETCGVVACAAPREHALGMLPLPGYSVRVLEPDALGVGAIAVAGPSVFAGYEPRAGEPEAPVPFDDGWFLTGDRGRLVEGRLFVFERTSDMFISGGENVYPREIEREILATEGVTEAAVIGVEDPEWGRRPVAFVSGHDVNRAALKARLEERLARFQRPDAVLVVDELPQTALGKTDRAALARRYRERLDVREANLFRICQRLKSPFRTSAGVMAERESVIVEVVDHEGRRGYGEGVAFSTPWYSPETVGSTLEALTRHLVPCVLDTTYLHPAEVAASFDGLPAGPMARGAIEPALWDLYGRITGKPMRELMAEWVGVAPGDRAPAGVSLGIMPVDRTLEEVRRYVEKGYRRVKLKIAPGDDVERVRAVREEHPSLMLMVDANRAYSAEDVDVFRRLDEFDLLCVEEPIAHRGFAELSRFQDRIRTPVCVDESVVTAQDLAEVLSYPNLRVVNLKIGKVGGVLPALRLYRRCIDADVSLWIGGMYETGVSKYLHAHFETLPGFSIPGDISESARYFERDVVRPPVRVEQGDVVLAPGPGLGFELDAAVVDDLLIEKIRVRRDED
jgi:O-succinylbenzoate synthase